jgi:hypothetical protein
VQVVLFRRNEVEKSPDDWQQIKNLLWLSIGFFLGRQK